MKKLIGILFSLMMLVSCGPDLPDLILDRHFFVDTADFMPEFGIRGDVTYSTSDGMYHYNPEKEEMTIFSDLGLSPEHQKILQIRPETIYYPDVFSSFGFRGDGERFICFHHLL